MTASTRLLTPTVAVTGSTGELGGRIAALLAERGIPQLLPVRVSRRAPRPARAQVVEVGGYTDRNGMERALRGIETLLIVPSSRYDDPLEGHRALFAAARAAGVRRIVLLSLATEAPHGIVPRAEAYAVAERDLMESGLDWTVARMNLALDLIPMAVARDGRLRAPSGGAFAPISYDDLAEALTQIVVDDRHAGRLLTFTGPEALSVDELGTVLSAHAPAPVRPVPCDPDAVLAGTQTDAWWLAMQDGIAAGAFRQVTSDLVEVLGRHPETVSAWLRRHPFALVHVGFTV